jgi:hypothetical protein
MILFNVEVCVESISEQRCQMIIYQETVRSADRTNENRLSQGGSSASRSKSASRAESASDSGRLEIRNQDQSGPQEILNARCTYSKFQASCKAFQNWNYGNIQDVFDTSFRIWKHSARAHESTAQIGGGRQHLKFSENI